MTTGPAILTRMGAAAPYADSRPLEVGEEGTIRLDAIRSGLDALARGQTVRTVVEL